MKFIVVKKDDCKGVIEFTVAEAIEFIKALPQIELVNIPELTQRLDIATASMKKNK